MKKYVIGVSGGSDSMCLLDKYKDKIVAVCHVNYNLRDSAKRDENIVKSYCKANNIALHISYPKYDKKLHNNFQSWAREQRYSFMSKIAKKYEADTTLIAHHLNDFLETAYMQLKKRMETLYLGIRKINEYKGFKIYRPLLECNKNELIDYCHRHNIAYGVDETNFDLKYQRNYVRQIINNWPIDKVNSFKLKIDNFNKKNELLRKRVESFYRHWKNSRNINVLFKNNEEFIFHVLYLLFMDEGVAFSRNKFEMFMSFAKKNNPNKLMRVGNNKWMVIRKRHLFFV